MADGLLLRAAIVGDLDQTIAEARQEIETAVTLAAREAAREVQSKLRQDVASSRLRNGARLQKTWRVRNYPSGKVTSLEPAALVYSTAPLLVKAFEQGADVKSPNGAWLAIPNPEVWSARPKRRGRESIITLAEARFGPLRMVFLKGRRDLALLVTDLRRARGKRGGYRKLTDAARSRGDFEEKVVFYLVPQARLPRLLKGETIRKRAERDFPAEVEQRVRRYLASGTPPVIISLPEG